MGQRKAAAEGDGVVTEVPAEVTSAPEEAASVVETRMAIGDELWIEWRDVASLREQDVNAQQMQPRHFDRLAENIRERGQIESLPYCHQPNGEGVTSIISGHHRARAARQAGLKRIPVIVDYKDMTRSQVVSKQIAHNELHGAPDEQVLRQLVSALDTVDDMLRSGLDEEFLPVVEPDDTKLLIPHAEFDWRQVTITFLPPQMQEFQEVVAALDSKNDMVGVASTEQFAAFSNALIDFSRVRNIKSMGATIAALTKIAREQVQLATDEKEAAENAAG